MVSEEEILKKLISFDTTNGDRGVSQIRDISPALDYVADLLSKNGITPTFQEYEIMVEKTIIKRRNLVAKLSNRPDLPQIGLQGHIDTVPFDAYSDSPLGKIENGRVYGRGAVDMKGSLAGMIYAMIEAKKIDDLTTNPNLIITSDEEANSFAGIKRYLKDKPELDLAICGEPSNDAIYDRFKGALWMHWEFEGKESHSSRPWLGENAIVKSLPVLKALIELHEEISKIKNDLFKSDDSHSEESSMNIGYLHGGTKVNVIPANMRIDFEMRLVYPAELYLEKIGKALRRNGAELGKLEFALDAIILGEKNPFSKKDNDKANLLYKRFERLSDQRKVMIGLAEANPLNRAGILTAVYGVGDNKMSHTKEEYVEISKLKEYSRRILEFVK